MRARLVAAIGMSASALASVAVAFALPPFTTGPKTAPNGSRGQAELYSLTVGCHATFDRVVVRARFAIPAYDASYVARVLGNGSGLPVPLAGTAKLRVDFRAARGHTTGGMGLLPAVVTPLCPNLRQVKTVGDFEGIVSLGLGMRHRAGFRIFRLTGPTRVVIDVAH